MEYEKLIKKEHIGVEDVTGKTFKGFTPSVGQEVVGRVEGKLYTYGWGIDDPDQDWNGAGPLGERVDVMASINFGLIDKGGISHE